MIPQHANAQEEEKREEFLWIDTDPSGLVWTGLDCDDDLAILMALELLSKEQLVGMSICGGNAPLKHTRTSIRLLLEHVGGHDELPIHFGRGWRSMQVGWSAVLNFLNYISPDVPDTDDAAMAMMDAAKKLPPNTLTVLVLGPGTNLARALELAPWLSQRLKRVVLMGGELTKSRMDLNFLTDRAAARTMVQSQVPTTMVPIQTCGQVSVTSDWLKRFETQCCPASAACAWLPKMRLQVQWMPLLVNKAVSSKFSLFEKWTPSPNLDKGFIPWDVVALLAALEPKNRFFEDWQYLRVAFPPCATTGEPCHGTMSVLQESSMAPSNYENWTRIPHAVRNETDLLDYMLEVLCSKTTTGATPPPQLLWGYLGPVLTTATTVFVSITCVLVYLVRKVRYGCQRRKDKQS